ncbi:hypothetical protein GCM10028819_06990 [Spirosoma humi]
MITEDGQPGKAEAFALLDTSCRRVSEAYGKPDWDTWTNSDYVSLSHTLFKQTRVRISPNTLKRIFGKIKTDARYYPQKATRDALAIYIGHPDWDHFVKVQEWTTRHAEQIDHAFVNEGNLPRPSTSDNPLLLSTPRPTKRNWQLPLFVGGAILLSIVLLLVQQRSIGHKATQLVCRNPLGENPHSAVFQLKHPGPIVEAGTYSILFGDGKRERLNATDSIATHYYERPGRYFAILQRDGVPIDTSTVYLQTKGWTVTANMMHDTSRVYPIEVEHLFTNGRRSVSAPEAARAGIDTNRTFFMEFINSHPTRIDGDNFELTTHIKTSPDRAGVRCSQVGITVWGKSSQHMFEVMRPGCAHWILMQNSDIQKSGLRDDLSFMGADLRSGGTLTLRVIDKQAVIFINNRQVYKTSYTLPLHQIYGVKIRFAGVGTVDSFSLKGLKSGSIFEGNF